MRTRKFAWSRFAVVCRSCNRRFRIGRDVLDEARRELEPEVSGTATDREIAQAVEFCMECTGGLVGTGEFIESNRLARRWDPKGWALDTLDLMEREMMAMVEHPDASKVEWYARRIRRRSFVARALRDRIDGRC